jgi:signal transduction histidine kinase
MGLAGDWSPARVALYSTLALIFTLLTQCALLPAPLVGWLRQPFGRYLLLMAGTGLLLQALSGDPYFQPIIFTIPFVDAALNYDRRRTILAGVLLVGCMVAGLWLGGVRDAQGLVFSPLAYSTLMVFMDAFTRMAADQEAARLRADQLAADLAGERDYLQQLIAVSATLTRDLGDTQVLEQVALHGKALAQAGTARVWLRAEDSTLQLAASVPPAVAARRPAAATELAMCDVVAQLSGGILALPMVAQGRMLGILELIDVGSYAARDTERLKPFADIAATAIENARLYAQAQESATYAERNRLARELHDTIAQGLTAVTMQLEASQRSLDRAPERARARLQRAAELARATLADVRRSVWTLAAPLVDGQLLPDALDVLARRFAERTGLLVRYDHHGSRPTLDHGRATQVLRIVQEALQNIEKHAQANDVVVTSTIEDGLLTIAVEDDGHGFDPAHVPTPTEDGGGFGLLSLRERARLAGGTFRIESTPGRGTRVIVTIQAGGDE